MYLSNVIQDLYPPNITHFPSAKITSTYLPLPSLVQALKSENAYVFVACMWGGDERPCDVYSLLIISTMIRQLCLFLAIVLCLANAAMTDPATGIAFTPKINDLSIFGVGVRLDSSFPWTQVQGNAGEYPASRGMTISPVHAKSPARLRHLTISKALGIFVYMKRVHIYKND